MTKRIDKFLAALKIEKTCEEEQLVELLTGKATPKQLQRQGKALANHVVQSVRTGLFDRMILTTGPAHGGAMPTTDISHGKPVVVQTNSVKLRGFVYSTTLHTVDICVDVVEDNAATDFIGEHVDILPSPDDITYRRMKAAAEELKKVVEDGDRMLQIILGEANPSPPIINEAHLKLRSNMEKLNDEQIEAVRASVSFPEVMCLHGPPGTGKSTTVAAIVAEAAARGSKTIVTCPSNAAVDALVEKLAKKRMVVTRLGHPARTSPHLRHFTLEAKMSEIEMLRDLRAEKYAASGRERGVLIKELRQREQKCSVDILKSSDVVVATCTVVGMKSILDLIDDPNHFSLSIVDEAGQAVEPAIYPILRRCSKKLILAGDPAQLPPTVMSKGSSILTNTLLEDVMKRHPLNTVLLKRQYRMNNLISEWVSTSMYSGTLIADETVMNHTLDTLRMPTNTPDDFLDDLIRSPLNLVDTAGCRMEEEQGEDDQSKSNTGEATIATLIAMMLTKAGIKNKDIAIISPYAAQVQLIGSLVGPSISVRTIDGYQGGEAEVVILSLVRSNSDGTTGFLSDNRRLNVAVSRARRNCIVIGDSTTVTRDSFIEKMFEYFGEYANLLSPEQFKNYPDYDNLAELAGYTASIRSIPTHQILSEYTEEPKPEPKKTVKPNLPKPKHLPKSKLEKRLEKQVKNENDILKDKEDKKICISKSIAELNIEEVDIVKCHDCSKTLPKENLELHKIHCARMMRSRPQAVENDKPKKTKMKPQKKAHQRITKNQKDTSLDKKFDNDDDLLDAAIAAARNCAFGSCKVSVKVMSFSCSTCPGHFCGTHKFPESHGCKTIPVSKRKPSSTSYDLKQKQLKNKLDSKLKTMENDRNRTTTKKK